LESQWVAPQTLIGKQESWWYVSAFKPPESHCHTFAWYQIILAQKFVNQWHRRYVAYIRFLIQHWSHTSEFKSGKSMKWSPIWIPKELRIKTEYARKSFRFMGAKIYNELPIEIRKTESFSDYSNLLKKHFSYWHF